ncbi:MAG TPA: DUF2231 domain-containing protein [Allocoleopsis sp.]
MSDLFFLTLNDHNLPYPDTIHPIVVHFVIAMVLFAVLCDFIGAFTRNSKLLEVSWWNLLFSTAAIFVAILFGQFEAGLAEPYSTVKPVLNLHTIIGWSLAAVLANITAWRFIIRRRDPLKLPTAYLAVGLVVAGLVGVQVFLGDELVWIYGLHTVPVVEAIKQGVAQ